MALGQLSSNTLGRASLASFRNRAPLFDRGLPFLLIRHVVPINVRNCHVILVFVDVSSTLNVRLQKPQWTT